MVGEALAAIAIGTLCGWLLLAAGVLVLAVVRSAGRAERMTEIHEMEYQYRDDRGDIYACPVCGRAIVLRGTVKAVLTEGDTSVAHSASGWPVDADPPEFTAWANKHQAELETL